MLRDLYRSIRAFFDKANPAGRPAFKAKRRCYATARWTKNGFTVSGTGLGHLGDRLQIATAEGRRSLRVVWSRPLPTAPSSVTIFRDRAGRYWASFVVRLELPCQPVLPTGKTTGLDVGLATFATTEDPSTDVVNPRFARRAAKARARSQRAVARKQKGSANRAQAGARLARIEARVAHQRRDFHHQAARFLVSAYDVIGVEDLSVQPMAAPGSRSAKGRSQPLHRRRRLGSVPRCPRMAGHEGRGGDRGAVRSWQHPTLFILRDESQAPHRALGPSVHLPRLRSRSRSGPQCGKEPQSGPPSQPAGLYRCGR